MSNEIKTTCPYCGVGCGVIAAIEGDTVTIQGDPEHPANLGHLCSKGRALGETLGLEGRLLHPEVNGEQVTWDNALDHVADRFKKIIDEYGPDAVAFYVSGQLLSEDYYVANKLMKGFIGSANIDTNSRLCMSSAVAGHKRAFGGDVVPGCYQDLEQAELVIFTGSNAAWCHPVLYQRVVRAKKANPAMKVVVIDPRQTATCDIADLHLPLAPGSDGFLFTGLLAHLESGGVIAPGFVKQHTEGVSEALAAARPWNLQRVAEACGVSEALVAEFYRLFAAHEKTVTLFSQGINQSSSGTDKANAVINCHLYTGRIGRPGMGPFSITGQPNAMGGREVGGLANQLAAHMALESADDRERVQRFWNAPTIAQRPGLKAVDLFRAVEAGSVKAVWIMATNPVVSLPDAEQVRRALEQCELVVLSDCVDDSDTGRYAHVRLPALTWGERDGSVTNSERRISRQRPFLDAPGEARADWWIVSRVAERMGFDFPYRDSFEIFREHAALSGFENGGERAFDISALHDLERAGYDALAPVQWPVNAAHPAGTPRLFGEGGFVTADGCARFIAVEPHGPKSETGDSYPLRLNSGRVRDQWHTMTRTGRSARLANHDPEPFVEVHPADAADYHIEEGVLARVTSPLGEVVVRARITERQRQGSLFVPIHWSDRFAGRARLGSLVQPHCDPFSGQPESKASPARIDPYRPAWHGFILSRHDFTPGAEYWARSKGDGLWRFELAGEAAVGEWGELARSLLKAGEDEEGWIEFADPAVGRYRAARVVDGRLESCLFVGPNPDLPARDWLASLFAQEAVSRDERAALLTARPPAGTEDAGHTVCACFNVGLNTLVKAIQGQGLTTVEAIGEALQAGTGCGSCVPELRALIGEHGEPLPLSA